MKQIFLRRSKCSTEPKAVIMAQSSKEETETEPFWLTLCDAPYREIPTFLRLRHCRGMRHTGTKEITLRGVSHTVTSRENVLHRFPGRRKFSPLSRGHPLTPVQNN